MTDTKGDDVTGRSVRTVPDESAAVEAVGTYEADGAVVFYDSENPLAWVQSQVTVTLEEAV